jgi:signal transduction histidine kinase
MDSFLGVPIQGDQRIFGAVAVGGSLQGNFDVDDERLVAAVATALGVRWSNARLQGETAQRGRWLEALADVQAELLRVDGDDPLNTIARRTSQISDADLVTVELVRPESTSVSVEVAVGDAADDLPAQHFSLTDTVRGQVIESGQPVRDVVDADGRTVSGLPLDGIGAGPVLVLPLLGISGPRGVLVVSRHQGRPAFTDAEMSLASSFAAQAGIALELADARELQEQTLLLLDRERIARDLHDHVIQELFSIGLRLDGAMSQGEMSPALAERIHECVEDLDRSIRRIRSTIFTLRGSIGGPGVDLRERVLDVTAGLQEVLGFAPAISFSGPVDTAVDPTLAADVEACVREALSNIARHAKATAAILDLALSQGRLVLTVADNGIGMPAELSRSSGLSNLRSRAREHGGDLDIRPRAHGGTVLEWTAAVR